MQHWRWRAIFCPPFINWIRDPTSSRRDRCSLSAHRRGLSFIPEAHFAGFQVALASARTTPIQRQSYIMWLEWRDGQVSSSKLTVCPICHRRRGADAGIGGQARGRRAVSAMPGPVLRTGVRDNAQAARWRARALQAVTPERTLDRRGSSELLLKRAMVAARQVLLRVDDELAHRKLVPASACAGPTSARSSGGPCPRTRFRGTAGRASRLRRL